MPFQSGSARVLDHALALAKVHLMFIVAGICVDLGEKKRTTKNDTVWEST